VIPQRCCAVRIETLVVAHVVFVPDVRRPLFFFNYHKHCNDLSFVKQKVASHTEYNIIIYIIIYNIKYLFMIIFLSLPTVCFGVI